MYLCNHCGQAFSAPAQREEGFFYPGGYHREYRPVCPRCGEEAVVQARLCPVCRRWMDRERDLCPSCQQRLREKLGAFLGELTAQELETLDNWLDGTGVRELL